MRMGWLVLAAALQDTQTAPENLPTVHPLSGKIGLWRSATDKIEPLEKPARVAPADRLGTAAGAPAQFSAEGSLLVILRGIKVSKEKGLALERREGRLALKVYEGTVVVESYEASIEVDTPHGKVTGKQVTFIATVDDRATKVVALEGRVTFSNDLGSVNVGEGTSSRGEPGKPPAPPRPEPAPDVDWVRSAEADSNLLRNPGFEEALEDWPVATGLQVREDREVFRSGKRSARVKVSATGSQPIFAVKTVRGLQPGARYLLRFFVRTEGLPGLKLVLDRTGRGAWTDDRDHHPVAASEGTWGLRRVTFEATGPEAAFSFHTPAEGATFSGTAWFDDFYLGRFPSRRP